MTIHPLLIAPHPALKTDCTPVDRVDDAVRHLMDDLLDSMRQADNGIGLAAPQIGITRRVVVIDLHQGEQPDAILKMANPEIIWSSDEQAIHEEGCLSIPDYYADIERPARVRVAYQDQTGQHRETEASDYLAVCLQHEIDHLNGILFIDHLSSLKRNIALRKMHKLKKSAALRQQTKE